MRGTNVQNASYQRCEHPGGRGGAHLSCAEMSSSNPMAASISSSKATQLPSSTCDGARASEGWIHGREGCIRSREG
eukprot:7554262-Pyramimonas_sp.AAC.1